MGEISAVAKVAHSPQPEPGAKCFNGIIQRSCKRRRRKRIGRVAR